MPHDRFAASRYEGSDADERRLFYVAMTGARGGVSMSRHHRVQLLDEGPTSANWGGSRLVTGCRSPRSGDRR